MKRILFICTGNTCRSPLAEGLLRRMAEEAGLQLEVRSAGVHAMDGGMISEHTAEILREQGAHTDIVSSAVRQEWVDWAELILTMTIAHKGILLQRFPHAIDKTFALKEFVANDLGVLAAIEEREQLLSELYLKQSLAQPITADDEMKLAELEKRIPNFDISDPYGGSLELYRRTAAEIEEGLRQLIARIVEDGHEK